MKHQKDNQPYLQDILTAIQAIQDYMQDAPQLTEFILGKGLYQDAVVRNIEIIGEATKKISTAIKTKHSDIPWKEMAGMRDKITHDYADIDWEEVWKVATEDVKQLKLQIQKILNTKGVK